MKEIRKGMLMVISGPSGTGKGTLAARLLAEDSTFGFSVSATTRAPRVGEVDGVHYHFLTNEQYDEAFGTVFRITTSANSIRVWVKEKPAIAFPIRLKVVR